MSLIILCLEFLKTVEFLYAKKPLENALELAINKNGRTFKVQECGKLINASGASARIFLWLNLSGDGLVASFRKRTKCRTLEILQRDVDWTMFKNE